MLARPSIWRLSSLSLVICPSTCPVLQGSVRAARVAANSLCSRLRKVPQFLIGTAFGSLQPGKQGLALALTDQAHKVLAERGERRKGRGKTKQCLPIGRILCIQFLWLAQEQPFHEDSVFGWQEHPDESRQPQRKMKT
jgi:hypothetical protein